MASIIIVLLSVIIILQVKKKPAKETGDLKAELDRLEGRLKGEFRISREEMAKSAERARVELGRSVEGLQKGNEKKLEEMRLTVDEKLQASVEKRFNESFKNISGQLERVYKGLGEMSVLATGVGDLKRVMEGVKTRGTFGEIQLGNLIADIFTKNQYFENVVTKKGSGDRVEFAIKMPGKDDDSTILLPIDSKFPTENYQRLLAAYDAGDAKATETFAKALATDIETQAKKINDKYLDVPYTTDFGVLFLPTESLFAEVIRTPGLLEKVQQKYRVTITGPTTLTALLNSLLLGFRTLAVEKRTSEVWALLGAVKTEFGKFTMLLEATEKKLTESANKIGEARAKSTTITAKLRSVDELPAAKAPKLIEEN